MTDDYISLYLAINKYPYEGEYFLALMFLTIARLFPIIMLSSFFGGKMLPHPVKVVFGLSLFAILLPKLLVVTKGPLYFDQFMVLLFVKELFIGFVIGVLVMAPLHAIEMAGLFVDHQRGGAALMINDPLVQSQSSPLGTLYNLIMVFIFFLMNGPFIVINAIFDSYEVIPPDQFLSRAFFSSEAPLWKAAIELFGFILVTAIRLASPSLLAMLMTDLFLGIINRMAPQVMITFLGMPLKGYLGFAVIVLGWKILLRQFVIDTQQWLGQFREIIESFRIGIPLPP